GIANRIAPQINVWMLSFTLRSYVGTIMLFFAFLLIVNQIENYTLMGNRHSREVISVIRFGEKTEVESPMPEESKDLKEIPRVKPMFDETGEK
ncbi:MAG: hypothetical protein ABIH76_08895, partial [Candidatus Bathyarchaeota archaeon]